ncbi:MAG: hypothetical protein ACRD27_07185 [Terracidiphilus sp.]
MLLAPILLLAVAAPCAAQPAAAHSQAVSPSSLRPQAPARSTATPISPCRLRDAGAAVSAAASAQALTAAGLSAGSADSSASPIVTPEPCLSLQPVIDWYARFLNGPQVKPLTPKEKAWLAVRNVGDPFNILTIVGEAAIAVAANSHSPYGPGVPGFGRDVGVSFTQDINGEFFGTFLIPSIARQDPHYHRMPTASIKRRIVHAIVQVVWTQGDNGRGMLNYANLVGFAIDDEIDNLYIPDRQTNLPASAERYATGLATAPVDNFITEFVPDVASHIHVHVVIVQRIINRVARTDSNTAP